MGTVWRGNLINRLQENKQFCEEIKVGTGVTEYLYSDRHPYEVTEVTDQKHIKIRALDHKPAANSQPMSNDWELISNENNPEIELVKRGNYWYTVQSCTIKELEEIEKPDSDCQMKLWFAHNNFDAAMIRKNGIQKRYHKMNISIGIADYYYYCYEI